MIHHKLTVPDLRKRLKLAGFRGSVRALQALGPIESAEMLCAYLHCSNTSPHAAFINAKVICDHHHLTVDVMDLVTAFQNRNFDLGWNQLPNGDATTGVLTREAAARAQIPAGHWATNPYRTVG
jgi:hypothetical protein